MGKPLGNNTPFEEKYITPIIAFMCLYEALAITSKAFPTVSGYVWSLYRKRWGQFLLWAAWGWLTAHFFRVIEEK